ncbi:hypothetical protein FRC08_006027 [Ceratobasidium sp. 394]|nr:hypothetical protein FRC08_006027 [Ceratobasidium sp. 394]
MSKVVPNDISMDTHSNVYDNAFRCWKSARTTLTRAISDYLTASAGLCSVLSSPTCHPSAGYSVEQTLVGIDLELSSLQLEEKKLRQTRTTLANERNRSRILGVGNKLPPEILATIFTLATGRYTRRDRTASNRVHSSPTTLASVSSFWRQIALRTPSLWSYVDLTVGGEAYQNDNQLAELSVKRSCNTLLCVNIRENYSFSRSTVLGCHVSSLVEFLAPLMHRVRMLEMSADLETNPEVLASVLALWTKHASTDIKKTLQVVNNPSDTDSDAGPDPAIEQSFSADQFNTLFRSFDRLFVQNYRISHSAVFHEGLVELHLQDIDESHSITQRQLAAMLAACARLRILVLANCWIEKSEEMPSSVALNHLQFLSLESENCSGSFSKVLPLLAVGSESLSMSLTKSGCCDFFDEAKEFFGRTKVTRLHVSGRQEPLSMLLYPIPHLETLALDRFDLSDEEVQDLVPWPRLRTLYLKDPVVDVTSLQQLVQLQRSLKTLHIYRPRTSGPGSRPMVGEERAHLADSMHMVENFQVEESNGGSCTIATWDFVILDRY